MAPITTSSNEANHQALLDKLDIYSVSKPFRNPAWKPPQRRNKNLKQIISEAHRREAASMLGSQAVSGSSTPARQSDFATSTGVMTPASNGSASTHGHGHGHTNIAQAAQRLDRLVLERNLGLPKPSHQATGDAASSFGGAGAVGGYAPMSVTYTNIESAPSLHPSSQKKYCDVTGLPTSYTDPKSRLRYFNAEIYGFVRAMPQGQKEGYLAARGAHTVLK
jgi:INO80 complex subunit C